jgi:small-conductance mechanosensitive channel
VLFVCLLKAVLLAWPIGTIEEGMWLTISEWLPVEGSFSYYLLRSTLTFLVVAVMARLLSALLWRIEVSRERFSQRPFNKSRQETLHALINSLLNGLAVLVTLVLILAMFVQPSALVTSIGLFSAGLGIAARPFISDFLGGVVLLFEDLFVIGDKVEIGDRQVIGVVERVSLRTTHIRGEAGELWVVPNGDVRTLRNFSRGSFSPANLRLTIPTAKFDEALEMLNALIAKPGPNVIEPPEIISESGEIGPNMVLLLKVKARHGFGSQVRREMLGRLQIALTEHGIIVDPDSPPEPQGRQVPEIEKPIL